MQQISCMPLITIQIPHNSRIMCHSCFCIFCVFSSACVWSHTHSQWKILWCIVRPFPTRIFNKCSDSFLCGGGRSYLPFCSLVVVRVLLRHFVSVILQYLLIILRNTLMCVRVKTLAYWVSLSYVGISGQDGRKALPLSKINIDLFLPHGEIKNFPGLWMQTENIQR